MKTDDFILKVELNLFSKVIWSSISTISSHCTIIGLSYLKWVEGWGWMVYFPHNAFVPMGSSNSYGILSQN